MSENGRPLENKPWLTGEPLTEDELLSAIKSLYETVVACAAGPWVEGEPPKDGEKYMLKNGPKLIGGYVQWKDGSWYYNRIRLSARLMEHTHHAKINTGGE